MHTYVATQDEQLFYELRTIGVAKNFNFTAEDAIKIKNKDYHNSVYTGFVKYAPLCKLLAMLTANTHFISSPCFHIRTAMSMFHCISGGVSAFVWVSVYAWVAELVRV